jgi:hypothetical protein
MRVSIRQPVSLLCAFLLLLSPVFAVQDLKPSRDNFFREVLYAKATSVTPLFDDYTEGSYHVDKLDVLKGLPEMAQKEGLKLRGLVVVGPAGPLWAYYVVAFLNDGEMIRVNSLTMPHARITYKSTGIITQKRYDELLNGLLKTNVLATELPPKGKCDTCPYPEWHYEVLAADWSNGKSNVYYGSLDEPKVGANTDSFEKQINNVLSASKKTYPLAKRRRSKSRRT